jgi:hypothetical protein
VHAQHFRFRRDRIVDEDGSRELPVLAEEHRAVPGHVHRHECVQQSGGEAALHHKLAELRSRHEGFIEV